MGWNLLLHSNLHEEAIVCYTTNTYEKSRETREKKVHYLSNLQHTLVDRIPDSYNLTTSKAARAVRYIAKENSHRPLLSALVEIGDYIDTKKQD